MNPTHPKSLLGLALTFALVASLPAQVAGGGFDKRFSWYGTADGDLCGHALAGVGDIDGDSVGDVILGMPGVDGPGGSLTPDYGRVEIRSGLTGALIFGIDGAVDGQKLGTGVSGLGDINADGIPDFAISSRLNGGEVILYSGLTGLPLLTVSAPAGATKFGEHLDSPGDVNADAIPDLLVAAPGSEFAGSPEVGAVFLISGTDGSVIHGFGGIDPFDNFGRQISCIGDLDGDAISEIVVSATGANPGGLDSAGSVFVYSSASGLELLRFDGDAPYDFFGWSVASAGDMDADGIPDLMIGSIFETANGRGDAGVVYFHSGATGALLTTRSGNADNEQFGAALATIGDMDEDGIPDHAIGSAGSAFGGQVSLYSGANGQRMFICESQNWNKQFGAEMTTLGDLDGDGKTEFMIGAHNADTHGPRGGAAHLYEFKNFLSVSTDVVSASLGANISIEIDFPSDWLYQPQVAYALLANTTGVSYSLTNGYPNPLRRDALFARTWDGYYPGSFIDAAGLLDENGDADARIVLISDAGLSFIGMTFHLSCAWYENAGIHNLIFRGFSRPLPITIIP